MTTTHNFSKEKTIYIKSKPSDEYVTIIPVYTGVIGDDYFRGYNFEDEWEIEKFPEDDLNNMKTANIKNNPSVTTLEDAWLNKENLIYT